MGYTMEYSSPIGRLTLASDGESITGLWTEGQKYFASTLEAEAAAKEGLPVFEKAREWLDRYFRGEAPEMDLPLAPKGSAFRQSVWEILCGIPTGELMTYGEIAAQMAKKLGKPTMSAQAVGGAVGHNPISILIPCHRVVGANGSLTGYAGGIKAKIRLLELEKADISNLHVPTKGTAL